MPVQIVLVEDEQNIRDTVSYALQQEGHRVTAYADGEQAWKALERRLPDLLILDILLPRLDGLELCRRVRARSESVPLMFLTSRNEEFDRVPPTVFCKCSKICWTTRQASQPREPKWG